MIHYGAAWYPEQWPSQRWGRDLELMREAGFTVVRIGDYAWAALEPAEGRFELDWMASAIDQAAEYGIAVWIATPTDAPPAWMSQNYPDILRTDKEGGLQGHGARRQFSATSGRYRELSAGIAGRLAERFGRHENVLGWQIANEFCYVSYDEPTRKLFQQWLAEQYGSLDELNRRWTTAYWAQTYNDWSQIPLPVGWPNPGLDLAFHRFGSEMVRRYQKAQIDAIRAAVEPRQWISHNFHNWDNIDWPVLADDLDMASWDPYPGDQHLQFDRFGWRVDLCRTLSRRETFWIAELQPGHVNWTPTNPALDRGEVRQMAWHFAAHGAAGMLYWQWRSSLNGQEQYHGTLVAPDGEPRPLYAEAATIGAELKRLGDVLDGTAPAPQTALITSYADTFVLGRQKQHKDFEPREHLVSWYSPLRRQAVDIDVIDARASLGGYKLLLAPHLHLLDEGRIEKLVAFVRGGGHLLLGPRSGFKDLDSSMLPSRQPGQVLSGLLGGHVVEFYTVRDPLEVSGPLGRGQAQIWSEVLAVDAADAEVLLRYGAGNGWVDGQPAMISRRVGEGRISYLGAWLTDPLMAEVMRWAVAEAGVVPAYDQPPAGVEVCRRVGGGRELLVVINHSAQPAALPLPRPMTDHMTGQRTAGPLELAGRAVAVLEA